MKIGNTTIQSPLSALSKTTTALRRHLERLSSGTRVSGPQDNSADYSIAVRLDSQIRGLRVGLQNIAETTANLQNNGASLDSQLDLVHRMREIAVSASSSSISTTERANLSTELQQLVAQFRQLSTSASNYSVQTGANAANQTPISLGSTNDTDIFRRTVGSGSFDSDITLSRLVGSVSAGIYAPDLNGDGRPDIATAALAATTPNIFISRSDGTFEVRRTTPPIADGIDRLAFGDINNDGKEDLVFVDSVIYLAGSMLGNGDGTFQTDVISTGVAGATTSLHLKDVTGDGNLDMVGSTGTQMFIYEGDGNGEFSILNTYNSEYSTIRQLELADINGDNILDAISIEYNTNDGQIDWRLGTGNGTFGALQTAAVGSSPRSFTVGDFNGDGRPDAAVANYLGGSVSIVSFTAAGAFGNRSTVSGVTAPTAITNADLNNDGILDLAVQSDVGTYSSYLLGSGGANFRTANSFGVLGGSGGIIAKDFSGDGVVDVIMAASIAQGFHYQKGLSKTVAGAGDIDIGSTAKAENLLKILDSALVSLNDRRANLTALHSRLDNSASAQLLLHDSLTEAKDSVTTADLALETAEIVRLQILQQAQIAVAAQSNTSMAMVLKLLG